jgi:hypothetical protein
LCFSIPRKTLRLAGQEHGRAIPLAVIAAIRRTDVTEHPAEDALLRLDVGRPDHLAPLFGVVGDELAEVGW